MTGNFIYFLLFVGICILSATCQKDEAFYRFKIQNSPQNKLVTDRLRQYFDIDCGDSLSPTMEIFGPAEHKKFLQQLNIKILEEEKARPFQEILQASRNLTSSSETNQPPGYDRPEIILGKLRSLAARTHLAKLIDLNQLFKLPKTTDGNSIYALKISKNTNVEDYDLPARVIVCNFHSRELMTPQICLDTAEKLVDGYLQGNTTIRSVVDSNEIFIVPTVNPDGLNVVWNSNNMWRKNRSKNPDGSLGKDLNRNFGGGWNFTCGGSGSFSSETYRGPYPYSEVESQVIKALMESYPISLVVDYHSYGREVRRNYGDCATMPPTMDLYFKGFTDMISLFVSGYRSAKSCCTGGNIASSYMFHGTLSTLIETGTAFQPPESLMRQEVEKLWAGTLKALAFPIPVQGHVLDDATGRPVVAKITVENLEWMHGEMKHSYGKYGRYFLWIGPGRWALRFEASGYQKWVQTIDLAANSPMTIDVRLKKIVF